MLAGEWKETYTASATAAGSTVQASAELFPVDLDPSLREYYERIAARIEA